MNDVLPELAGFSINNCDFWGCCMLMDTHISYIYIFKGYKLTVLLFLLLQLHYRPTFCTFFRPHTWRCIIQQTSNTKHLDSFRIPKQKPQPSQHITRKQFWKWCLLAIGSLHLRMKTRQSWPSWQWKVARGSWGRSIDGLRHPDGGARRDNIGTWDHLWQR